MDEQGLKMDDLYDTEWDVALNKFYTRAWGFICDRKTVMLMPIHLKIDKKQKFYSKTEKKHLYLGPTWQMYLISRKTDDKGRVLIYAPYLFFQGQVFLVPEELIIELGYN